MKCDICGAYSGRKRMTCINCYKTPAPPIAPKRYCRLCKKPLPVQWYFYHSSCSPQALYEDVYDMHKQDKINPRGSSQ